MNFPDNKKILAAHPIIDAEPLLSDVTAILWNAPREAVQAKLPPPAQDDPFDYIIGMTPEESAFVCGLIRERNPKKILEVGVNKGGSTAVLLKTLELLNSTAPLYSVDINADLPAKQTLKLFPELTDRLVLNCGRDVSAYLEEIGGDIDFCILDTAHYLPGEVLNFLCILPYLKDGATVVIHDQVHHFDVDSPYIRLLGSTSVIACRVLHDTVVADKLVPDFAAFNKFHSPNIASFTVTEDTRRYVRDLFSALMLPWRLLPSKDHLNDAAKSIKMNYPPHYFDYFIETIRRQATYHMNRVDSASAYWQSIMQEAQIKHGSAHVAFYGAGGYCKNLLESILPQDLWPAMVFDKKPSADSGLPIPIHGKTKLEELNQAISVLIITSVAHNEEIYAELSAEPGLGFEIVNPFNPIQ